MMSSWLRWISDHQTALGWLIATSILTFVVSLILVPVFVARIPSNYFEHEKRPQVPWATQHPAMRAILLVAKNVGGVLLVILGLVMLVIPGQGIASIVVGITLLDFPGKFRLERWLISHSPVLRSINWLRQRAHKEPLVVPEKERTKQEKSHPQP